MGWSGTPYMSFKSVRRYLAMSYNENKLLKSCFIGNVCFKGTVYQLWERDDDRFLEVIMMECVNKVWYHKSVWETCGSVQCDCPMSYILLRLESPVIEKNTQNWLASCVCKWYHKRNKSVPISLRQRIGIECFTGYESYNSVLS